MAPPVVPAAPKDIQDATKIAQNALIKDQDIYIHDIADVFKSASAKFTQDYLAAAASSSAAATTALTAMQAEVVRLAEKRYDAEVSAEKKMISRMKERQKSGIDLEVEGLGESRWAQDFSGESQAEMMEGKLEWGDIEKEAVKPLGAVHKLTKEIQEALAEGRSETVFELAGNEEMKSLTR